MLKLTTSQSSPQASTDSRVCQAKRGPRYRWFGSYFLRMPDSHRHPQEVRPEVQMVRVVLLEDADDCPEILARKFPAEDAEIFLHTGAEFVHWPERVIEKRLPGSQRGTPCLIQLRNVAVLRLKALDENPLGRRT